MKLKSITIEGMHNVIEKTYTFNDLNYLFGNNGAGKSTALQAIQLALLGYIPGTSKTNAAIYRHARRKAMSVTAVLSREDKNLEDITITRTWAGSGKSVNSSVTVTPEGFDITSITSELELPIFNFNEFVGMTANKLKDWFIEFLPKASDNIEWEDVLKESLGDKIIIDDTLLPSTLQVIKQFEASGLEGVDLVRKLNDYFKEETSYQKGQLSRSQSTIHSLIFYDDCETVEDVEERKAKLKELQDLRIKLSRYEQMVENNRRVKEMYDAIEVSADSIVDDTRYSELCVKADNIKKEIDSINNSIREVVEKINMNSLEEHYRQNIMSGGDVCPYTNKSCESMKEIVEAATRDLHQLQDELDKLSEQKAECVKKRDELSLELNACNRELSSIESEYRRKKELEGQLIGVPPCPTTMSDEEISREISKISDVIIKAEANKRYNELTDKLTSEKYKIEDTLEVLKIWSKLTDANGLQTSMMSEPFEKLASMMDACLHNMFGNNEIKAAFNLSEKANSFSFGMIRDGKYIPFDLLSSGEKCLYTIALMVCLLANSECPLNLILIDDLLDHLDDDNASYLFESLSKLRSVQFVLAGVKECRVDNSKDIVIEV